MKQIKTTMFAIMICGAWTAEACANTTYVWTTILDAGPVVGGSVSEFAGTIVLDSNFSVNGTLADVISVSLTTPQGNFTYDPTTAFDDSWANGGFKWNANQIENMYIGWKLGPYQVTVFEGVGYGPGGLQVTKDGINASFDEAGSWLAATSGSAVPEPATWAIMLLGFGGLGFAAYRRANTKGHTAVS